MPRSSAFRHPKPRAPKVYLVSVRTERASERGLFRSQGQYSVKAYSRREAEHMAEEVHRKQAGSRQTSRRSRVSQVSEQEKLFYPEPEREDWTQKQRDLAQLGAR